mmetsp:Transcript_10322/g.12114  ORF Transcript_10322/g.12114 Transcript_10322/m.12114 type:complete len:92 (+) Transcript_10322:1596-1871(+)
MKAKNVLVVERNMLIPISSIVSLTRFTISMLGFVREKAPVIMKASSKPIPAKMKGSICVIAVYGTPMQNRKPNTAIKDKNTESTAPIPIML